MSKDGYVRQGISFPDAALLEKAKARARAERRSLSNYLCGLLEKDLAAASPMHDQQPAAPDPEADQLVARSQAKAKEVWAKSPAYPPLPKKSPKPPCTDAAPRSHRKSL